MLDLYTLDPGFRVWNRKAGAERGGHEDLLALAAGALVPADDSVV